MISQRTHVNRADDYTALSDRMGHLLILRMATRSRKHALAAVAGIVTGSTVWVTLTVVGSRNGRTDG